MNLFKFNKQSELESKVSAYETTIQNLEHDIQSQSARIDELVLQLENLVLSLKDKEETIEIAEQTLVETEKELTETKDKLEQTETLVEKVIENTSSIEQTLDKQAAIKAAIILGELGTDIVETVEPPKEVNPLEHIKSLPLKELIEFYNQNKPSLKGFIQKPQ